MNQSETTFINTFNPVRQRRKRIHRRLFRLYLRKFDSLSSCRHFELCANKRKWIIFLKVELNYISPQRENRTNGSSGELHPNGIMDMYVIASDFEGITNYEWNTEFIGFKDDGKSQYQWIIEVCLLLTCGLHSFCAVSSLLSFFVLTHQH